jgi:hypothetical protein
MNVAQRRTLRLFVSAIAGVALCFSFAAIAFAASAGCSHDALTIDGMPVTVVLCATKSDPKTVTVSETFTSKSATLAHATTIDVLPGEESSRGIDDVPLAQLAIAKTIHITMHYRAGAITLEHALLLPGAVPLK